MKYKKFNKIIFTILYSLFILPTIAGEQNLKISLLQLYWQLEISQGYTYNMPGQLQHIANVVRTKTGEILALGNGIVPLNQSGPAANTFLHTKATILAAGPDGNGNIWAGGLNNHRGWIPGGDLTDAYIGKFDRTGQKLTELVFSDGRRQISSLHPRRDGGVLVTGPIEQIGSRNGTWLASISPEGKIAWEKTIGLPKRAAIIEGYDGNIGFIGIRKGDSTGQKNRLEVVFWLFNPQGNILAEHVINPNSNTPHGSLPADRYSIEASPDGFFALLRWYDSSTGSPLSVIKLSTTGDIHWNVTLRHTAAQWPERPKVWEKCDQQQAILGNGDLLITCSLKDEIVLSRLDGKSGIETQQRVALPSCHDKRPALITPFPVDEHSILLFGTRPSGNVGASCAWLAELALKI